MLSRSARCFFERHVIESNRSRLHTLSPAPASLPQSPHLDIHSMHKILLCTMREQTLGTDDASVLLPKRWHNPLTTDLLKSLCDLFTAVSKDSSIHGIVLCASRNGQIYPVDSQDGARKEIKPKEHIFSAGLDLRALQKIEIEAFEELWFTLQELWIVMHLIQKPLIACMEGDAVGLGCALALACDVRVAQVRNAAVQERNMLPVSQKEIGTDSWKIGLNEVRYGFMTPPWVATSLSYLIGHRQANKLIQTGALITPSHAHSLGIVDLVVENDPKMAALEHMHQLLSVPAYGREQAKSMLRRDLLSPLATAEDRMHDMTHYTTLLRTRGFKKNISVYLDHMDPEVQMLPSESKVDSWDPINPDAWGETICPENPSKDEIKVATSERTMEDMANTNVLNRDADRF